jgi:hypothetical protein
MTLPIGVRPGGACPRPQDLPAAWYYSRGFTLSCCLRQLSSGRFSIRSYDE